MNDAGNNISSLFSNNTTVVDNTKEMILIAATVGCYVEDVLAIFLIMTSRSVLVPAEFYILLTEMFYVSAIKFY